MIALVTPEHLIRAEAIHKAQYKDQFDFPAFKDEFILIYSSVNKDGELVSIAGVKPILEMVAITDQTKPVRERYTAVYDILAASQFTAASHKHNQLHAFVQDPHWMEVMLARGFCKTKGQALVIGV